MATTEERITTLETQLQQLLGTTQQPVRFWQGMQRASLVGLLDKILVGLNADGSTKYANVNDLVSILSASIGTGIEPSVEPGSELPTPEDTKMMILAPGTYTQAEGGNLVAPTNAFNVAVWDGTEWRIVTSIEANVELTNYATKGEFNDLDSKTKLAQSIEGISNTTYKWGVLSSDNKVFVGVTSDDKFDAPGGLSEALMQLIKTGVSPDIIVSATAAALSGTGYKEITNSQWKGGFLTSDEKVLFGALANDKFDAPGGLSDALMLQIKTAFSDISASNIIPWFGDSLTNNGTAVNRLQTLLGSKYIVKNEGVGGESVPTICARIGGVPARIATGFTLPGDKTPVQVATQTTRLTNYKYGAIVTPLLQSVSSRINPVYVQDVECTLKWTGSAYDDPAGVWTIERNTAGTDKYIEPNSLIYPVGAKLYKHVRAAVYWMGQNAGYTSPAQLVEYLRASIDFNGVSDYIIVGLHTGTPATRAELEDVMLKEFGVRYINLREYISKYALSDMGITPTADDLAAQTNGTFPPSLWSSTSDSIHMNANGYTAVANKVYSRMLELGMF